MSTPLCRCRVLYLGCAVPKITKDGLQGIQDPLKEIYPDGGAVDAAGIDAWLSVWSNGMLLEYLDSIGSSSIVTKFMPIETLHYCAAVRFVEVTPINPATPISEVVTMRFFPLDSPRSAPTSSHHPPLFACIMRRISGIKVLECHGFICKNEMAANALVKACFHAYSDSMHLRMYEFVPQAIPVVIPKKKSIFKLGKKSRSKSAGRSMFSSQPVVPLSPASTVSLDPYVYNRVNEWRTPTPRPVFLRTTPTPLLKPVPAGDYRYASNGILSSNGDNRKPHKVWSGSNSSTGGSDRDTYVYGSHYSGNPLSNHHLQPQQQPVRRWISGGRENGRAESEYAADGVLVRNRRPAVTAEEEVYTTVPWQAPMTSYQPTNPVPTSNEQYYEATTFERRKMENQKKKTNNKIHKIEQEHVSHYNSSKPVPYMNELERTISNGLPGRRNDVATSTVYKRYESMPELNHIMSPSSGTSKWESERELPVMMNGMRLRGSAGSADRTMSTGSNTPISTPAASSLSEHHYRDRNGRMSPPIIPEADYYH